MTKTGGNGSVLTAPVPSTDQITAGCDGCAVVTDGGRFEWAHALGCPNDQEGAA